MTTPAPDLTGEQQRREMLAAALIHANAQVGPDTTDFVRDLADALLPVVRKIAADELLWAATEAECHADLCMLKRRADALDPS